MVRRPDDTREPASDDAATLLRAIVDNVGTYLSSINTIYNNTGPGICVSGRNSK